ncbi:MAG: phosphotyrosine protein phosphatase [Thermus sp.]|uniref:low molecular weight protein-tyrosine-phosphatase n=1 Tax=Thermus sp. TaxID=275 RepID=UPI00332B0ED5
MGRPIRVLFVCLGNICRSPMAKGIFLKLLRERGLSGRFEVDSAGLGGWHVGEGMDPRARRVLEEHGAFFPHRARRLSREDCERFDHILVMDRENLEGVLSLCPKAKEKVRLVLDFSDGTGREVPDPYYEDLWAFREAYLVLEEALKGFLDWVVRVQDAS